MASALQALMLGNLAGGGGAAPRSTSTAPASLASLISNSFALRSNFSRSVARAWPSAVCSAFNSIVSWARNQRSQSDQSLAAAVSRCGNSAILFGIIHQTLEAQRKRSIDFAELATSFSHPG